MAMVTKCPKCGYQRTADDDKVFPDWQCPQCKIAYNKVAITASVPENDDVSSRDQKHCPFCGEEILAVAIKCKHCGSNLVKNSDVNTQSRVAATRTKATDKKKSLNEIVVSIFILIVLLIHGIIFSKYDTLSPCVAAAKRAVDLAYKDTKKPTTKAEAFGQELGRKMTEGFLFDIEYSRMKEKSIFECYAVSLGLAAPK